jgi:hypothetical protein
VKVVEELSDCDFLEFSKPIDDNWIFELKNHSKIYIIGQGVTAIEYAHILSNYGMVFECLDPEVVIKNPNDLCNGYSIVACHHHFKTVINALEDASLLRGKDYNTFYNLLRNRAVFDFREDILCDKNDFIQVVASLKSMVTVGGIDIFINASNFEYFNSEFGELLKDFTQFFHIKVSIEIDCIPNFESYHSFYVDLIEIIVRSHYRSFFDADAFHNLNQIAQFKNAHVIYIDCIDEKRESFSSERQIGHPKYYDETILNHKNNTFMSDTLNNSHCLSRRMFPIFDNKVNLKLCSLFNSLALTSFTWKEGFSSEYIRKRNTLCLSCKNAGIYRKK